MTNRTFDRLFCGALVLVALRLTHVLSKPVFAIVILVLAGGLMLFLSAPGGHRAKTGALIVMLVAVPGAVSSFAPTRATADFYAAASGIIPVLLLALAIEVRLFRDLLDVACRYAQHRILAVSPVAPHRAGSSLACDDLGLVPHAGSSRGRGASGGSIPSRICILSERNRGPSIPLSVSA
jgi:hypothetical protein